MLPLKKKTRQPIVSQGGMQRDERYKRVEFWPNRRILRDLGRSLKSVVEYNTIEERRPKTNYNISN